MNEKQYYINKAEYLMQETYEMDMDGDMALETAKQAFSKLIESPEFLDQMKQYLMVNELVPDERTIDFVFEQIKERILPEVNSLLRTIG